MSSEVSDVLDFLRRCGIALGVPTGGGNWSAYCPVHGETPGKSKPALSVHEDSGLWHCYACGAGGRLEQLVAAAPLGGTEGEELLRQLRRDDPSFGKPIPRMEGNDPAPVYLPKSFLHILYVDPPGLLAAGFDPSLLRSHFVGTDRVKNRTVYPIFAPGGELAGLVGKQEDAAARSRFGKYKVYQEEIREIAAYMRVSSFSPAAYTFRNHDWVWRIDKVRTLPPEEPIIVCEGFKAALWMVQHGFPGAVALMGTSMTQAQSEQLQRLKVAGRRFILCLDNDPAGISGTARIRAGGTTLWYRVEYPEGVKQVDDIKDGEVLREMVRSACLW